MDMDKADTFALLMIMSSCCHEMDIQMDKRKDKATALKVVDAISRLERFGIRAAARSLCDGGVPLTTAHDVLTRKEFRAADTEFKAFAISSLPRKEAS